MYFTKEKTKIIKTIVYSCFVHCSLEKKTLVSRQKLKKKNTYN